MNIQHISFTGSNHRFEDLVEEHTFDKAKFFDDYDVNIVDLTDPLLWKYKGYQFINVNSWNNIKSVGGIIEDTKVGTTLILLPSNIKCYYNYSDTTNKYRDTLQLKDELPVVSDVVLPTLGVERLSLSFGLTVTMIGDTKLNSDFYFPDNDLYQKVTCSESGIVTTVRQNRVYLSTCRINDTNELVEYLVSIRLMEIEKEDSPGWFSEIKCFDDLDQEKRIDNSIEIINREQEQIREAKKVLEENNKWKSIIYSTGEELVSVVSQMIDLIFGVDTNHFEDLKKEDFRFEYNDKTIIGEIKGISTNVKKANISQLDTHVQEYLDTVEGEETDILAWLVINHQRRVEPKSRECIPKDQIRLAKRNGSLIIETTTLLRMFEQFCDRQLTTEDIWELMSTETGLLTL